MGSLILLMTAIGVAHGLLRTEAYSPAQWADVLPILLSQLDFIGIYLRWHMGIVLGTLFWGGRDFWGSLPGGSRGWRQHLNGSLAHTQRLVVLMCLGVCQGQIGPDPVLLLWPLEVCSHSLP